MTLKCNCSQVVFMRVIFCYSFQLSLPLSLSLSSFLETFYICTLFQFIFCYRIILSAMKNIKWLIKTYNNEIIRPSRDLSAKVNHENQCKCFCGCARVHVCESEKMNKVIMAIDSFIFCKILQSNWINLILRFHFRSCVLLLCDV